MRKRLCYYFILAALVLLLLSCVSAGVKSVGDYTVLQGYKKIAFVQFSIANPTYPVLPIIDAAAYKDGAIKIAAQTMAEDKKNVEALNDYLAKAINVHLQNKLVYGKDLVGQNAYKQLPGGGIKTYSVKIADKTYPQIFNYPGCYNFFDFSKSEQPYYDIDEMLKANKENLGNICKALNVDAILIGMTNVSTVGVAVFGISGGRASFVKLIFINNEGDVILQINANGKPVGLSGNDVEGYKKVLNDFNSVTDMIMEKVFK